MNQQGAEAGNEFVLDNRKLIVAFLLLVLVCGAFFVIGFMEGKRQAIQTRVENMPATPPPATAEVAKGLDSKGPGSLPESKPITDRSVRAQLDWYKNVQGGERETKKPVDAVREVKSAAPPATKSPAQPAGQAAKSVPGPATGSMVPAANISYTVQVGAFKQRRQAESVMAALKAKSYECVLEVPKAADQLYRVKVGKFTSRAEAKAMQLRLKQDGFDSMVKPY